MMEFSLGDLLSATVVVVMEMWTMEHNNFHFQLVEVVFWCYIDFVEYLNSSSLVLVVEQQEVHLVGQMSQFSLVYHVFVTEPSIHLLM
jgi:hypothetical protein